MGLINLKTNLKSLKYGKDRIGGGYSQQPLIQTPIPDGFSSVGNVTATLAQKVVDDVSRITQLFFSGKTVQGPLFAIKQNYLSKLGTKTQANLRPNEGIYLPTSTIAQTSVLPIGLHFNKQGANPIPGSSGALTTYSDVVKLNQTPDTNRLVKYYSNFVLPKTLDTILDSYPGGPGSNAGIGTTDIKLASDRTGVNNRFFNNSFSQYTLKTVNNPVLGVGKQVSYLAVDQNNLLGVSKKFSELYITGIQFPTKGVNSVQSASLQNIPATSGQIHFNLPTYNPFLTGISKVDGIYDNLFNLATIEYQSRNIEGQPLESNSVYKSGSLELNPDIATSNTAPQDVQNPYGSNYTAISGSGSPTPVYKSGSVEPVPVVTTSSFDTSTAGVDSRITTSLLPKSNSFRKYLKNYTSESIERKVYLGNPAKGEGDRINSSPIGVVQNDLITFKFQVLGGNTVQFRAFLDGFSDDYSADWNNYQYVGRGEKFYSYTGFGRTINLSWTVAAQSKEELKPMYQRLNYLASTTAPTYTNGFMAGNLIRLTVGNYVTNLPGKIDSMNIQLEDQSPWDIDQEMPMVIKVSSFSFTPIHDFAPQFGKPFISYV